MLMNDWKPIQIHHEPRDQACKDAVQCDGLAPDVHDAASQPEEQANQREHADQAELFADHGEQEVGVGFGQPMQLFNAADRANTKDFAPAKCDQRMRELVALAQGVLSLHGSR